MGELLSFSQFINEWRFTDHYSHRTLLDGDHSQQSRVRAFDPDRYPYGWHCSGLLLLDAAGRVTEERIDVRRFFNLIRGQFPNEAEQNFADFEDFEQKFKSAIETRLETMTRGVRARETQFGNAEHVFACLGKIAFVLGENRYSPEFINYRLGDDGTLIRMGRGEAIWVAVKNNYGITFIFKPQASEAQNFIEHLQNIDNRLVNPKYSEMSAEEYLSLPEVRLVHVSGRNFSNELTVPACFIQNREEQAAGPAEGRAVSHEIVFRKDRTWVKLSDGSEGIVQYDALPTDLKKRFDAKLGISYSLRVPLFDNQGQPRLTRQNTQLFMLKKDLVIKQGDVINLRKSGAPRENLTAECTPETNYYRFRVTSTKLDEGQLYLKGQIIGCV